MYDWFIKKIYEYKLDLLYYAISVDKDCYNSLRKGNYNQINHNDYITTNGLMLILNSTTYVNAKLYKYSPYRIYFLNNKYVLKFRNTSICSVKIIQPPVFALEEAKLSNGELITDYVNIHGDRPRLQPIEGCANMCKFCDLNTKKYKQHSIKNLEEAFTYALKRTGFNHVLISGGSPKNTNDDYEYLNDVYKYFGEKYGKRFPIDIMLVPRGLDITENSISGYERFLKKLKEWNISGLSINLELHNSSKRKKFIPQKAFIGKERYFKFIELAVKMFGKGNVRSCIIIGLESIEDSLKVVEELCKVGCMPVLSPYIPINGNIPSPKPELMKKVLLKTSVIAKKYNIEIGPKCDSCKHNTINF